MDRVDFSKRIKEKIMVLDGATGTELQKRGMPKGVCPEKWTLDNPDILLKLQTEYVEAGSEVIYTCTLGGTRLKLDEYSLGDSTFEINRRQAELSRKAAGKSALVAGDISSTGYFVRPFGDLPFEKAVEVYKEQVRGLLEGGVDFFIIETMVDIQEARAALLAVKETCRLPVCVSMTFNEDGRTLTGTDPAAAIITLQSMGADVAGCNCSTGPKQMLGVVAAMKAYARIPIIAKPNAGLPRLQNGNTVFDMEADEFASYMMPFIENGVNLIGGCCGTSPGFIRKIVKEIGNTAPLLFEPENISVLTSARRAVIINRNNPITIIGERINPTGKKVLQSELQEGKKSEVKRLAIEQTSNGADILDVNVGMPGINEKHTMVEITQLLSSVTEAPLCIDSSNPEVIEAALRSYPGRALVNSISGEKAKLEKLLPVAAKYGAMFILLPLDDEGIPDTAEGRSKIVEKVYDRAKEYGYTKNDFMTDGLVMTVSSDASAPRETLKLIKWCNDDFGCATVIGLSNISFGLPERKWINGTFLAMAAAWGLTAAIANPSGEMLMSIKRAADVLTGKDEGSGIYIEKHSGLNNNDNKNNTHKSSIKALSIPEQIYNEIVSGDREKMKELLEEALNQGLKPSELVDDYLIPAITYVGELYDKRKYFLPQLIRSAQSMQSAFSFLEPLMLKNEGGASDTVRIVIATVKGDIHDIGKNIVTLMLKNYGFKVYDLGKDVSAQDIVSRAKLEHASVIALSALMTTTMVEMKDVVDLARKELPDCRIIVGGAVVNSRYADEIGADGYSPDAYKAVELVKRLV